MRKQQRANRVVFAAVLNLKGARWTDEKLTECFLVFVVEPTFTRGATHRASVTAFHLRVESDRLARWWSGSTLHRSGQRS